MICKVCGRTIANEAANFCEYCGAAVNGRGEDYSAGAYYNSDQENENRYGGNYGDSYNNWRGNQGMNSYTGETAGNASAGAKDNSLTGILSGTAGTAEAENSMSFLHWVVVLLLPYIPIIGTFAYFILLFAWSFGRTASTTRKNWARATLVMLVVAIVIMSYALGGMLADGSFADMLSNLGM